MFVITRVDVMNRSVKFLCMYFFLFLVFFLYLFHLTQEPLEFYIVSCLNHAIDLLICCVEY